MHGLSLNVRPNLDHFKHIVPCGIGDRPVGSRKDGFVVAFWFIALFRQGRGGLVCIHNQKWCQSFFLASTW